MPAPDTVVMQAGRHASRRRSEYIGGWAVADLLAFLRDLEQHGYGEVTVTAHQGRFDVRETKTHRAREEQPKLTE